MLWVTTLVDSHQTRSLGVQTRSLGVQTRSLGVTLSEAKGLSHWTARCFAALSMTGSPCHPERSEGPLSMGSEMLRYAQHDRTALSMTVQV